MSREQKIGGELEVNTDMKNNFFLKLYTVVKINCAILDPKVVKLNCYS